MITYELAKQLKDAGFPQTWPQPDYMEIHDAIKVSNIMDKYKKDVYMPTLPELIVECTLTGDIGLVKNIDGWSCAFHDHTNNIHELGQGSTPEEAVANLWLELQVKR